jgi:two-component system NarL family sensor kinase
VAWLRLPAIALVALGEVVTASPERHDGFVVALTAFAVWAVAVFVWVHLRTVGSAFGLMTAIVDITAITVLAFLSGGAGSQVRLTAVASGLVVLAYLAQAFSHPSSTREVSYILLQAGYLTWLGIAATLLAWMLARRTQRIGELVAQSRHLLVDSLGAEERERQALAEALHDTALQNLLSARHDLQEAFDAVPHPAVARAEATITETVGQLRDVVTDLHPLVLDQAGLEAALSAAGAHAGRRGRFTVRVTCTARPAYPEQRVLLAAARELLTNVTKYARAHQVDVRCVERNGWTVLSVSDDGVGFDPSSVSGSLTSGHIGLASQRTRIESAGGDLMIESRLHEGTTVTVRLPIKGTRDRR